jgi:quercetin dioxygenase-like cupin family protein
MMALLKWEDLGSKEVEALYRDRLASGQETRVVRVDLSRGETVAARLHDREEIIIVLHGACRVDLESRQEVLQKNQMVFIPSGTFHSFTALEDSVVLKVIQHPSVDFSGDNRPSGQENSEQDLWAV